MCNKLCNVAILCENGREIAAKLRESYAKYSTNPKSYNFTSYILHNFVQTLDVESTHPFNVVPPSLTLGQLDGSGEIPSSRQSPHRRSKNFTYAPPTLMHLHDAEVERLRRHDSLLMKCRLRPNYHQEQFISMPMKLALTWF